jgi:cytoskeletal protein CcmA (bactofilin family)
MTNRAYNDPEGDVEISTAHRGDIRCRKLVVTSTGSIVGNVEAYDVRNSGRINGIINATNVFINNEGARFRGSVYAPHLGIHPKSVFEATASNSHRVNTEHLSSVLPSAIENAVQEGLRREIAKRGLASDDQGFNVSADTRFSRPAADRSADDLAPATAPASFRTSDGRLWPYQPSDVAVEFTFAPPGPSKRIFIEAPVDLQFSPPGPSRTFFIEDDVPKPLSAAVTSRTLVPRALPPLFATDK